MRFRKDRTTRVSLLPSRPLKTLTHKSTLSPLTLHRKSKVKDEKAGARAVLDGNPLLAKGLHPPSRLNGALRPNRASTRAVRVPP